jgi:hypothetical protein
VKLPLIFPVPARTLQAAIVIILEDGLVMVQDVSVGRKPDPVTTTSVPIRPAVGLRVIVGPTVTLKSA